MHERWQYSYIEIMQWASFEEGDDEEDEYVMKSVKNKHTYCVQVS